MLQLCMQSVLFSFSVDQGLSAMANSAEQLNVCVCVHVRLFFCVFVCVCDDLQLADISLVHDRSFILPEAGQVMQGDCNLLPC